MIIDMTARKLRYRTTPSKSTLIAPPLKGGDNSPLSEGRRDEIPRGVGEISLL